MDDTPLPQAGGTYVLVMEASAAFVATAGGLGERAMDAGWYLYVGSALGPGGLAARCGRHLRRTKVMRWHIDYLRPRLQLHEIWYRSGPPRCEHSWAAALAGWPETKVAWPRFGASDCRCAAHLLHRCRRPQAAVFRRLADDAGIARVVVKESDR